MSERLELNTIEAVLFDIDGVLQRGSSAQPAADELLRLLALRDVKIACITNNSMHTSTQISRQLQRLGVPVPAKNIVTSADVTRSYLDSVAHPGAHLLIVGMGGLRRALLNDGRYREDHEAPDFVVVGLDQRFNYRTGSQAVRAITTGARLIATNDDRLRPGDSGVEPEAGAILNFILAATGAEAVVTGKPAPEMFNHAMRVLGAEPNKTLVVGDNIETDIAGAHSLGLRSVLVKNGVPTAVPIRGVPASPTMTVPDLQGLLRMWS